MAGIDPLGQKGARRGAPRPGDREPGHHTGAFCTAAPPLPGSLAPHTQGRGGQEVVADRGPRAAGWLSS